MSDYALCPAVLACKFVLCRILLGLVYAGLLRLHLASMEGKTRQSCCTC
jgi:hypothetical protein